MELVFKRRTITEYDGSDMQNGSGAAQVSGGTHFSVWAPTAQKVELVLPDKSLALLMEQAGDFWHLISEDAPPGTKYLFRLDGKLDRPDPASRFQPEGVHGPSQVVNPEFSWSDSGWYGIPISSYVLYEIHIGTYTDEGTFESLIQHLPKLKELGITAIELLPVAQFPGSRNWGYDGVYPYAVQTSYGGPGQLKRLVDEAHKAGLAVVLDVVYNHLGPEGNYLSAYGPYFTDYYKTPWGDALNFGRENSGPVRDFFLGNAAYWIKEFHMDGLRLDATHEMFDSSATHILEDLARTVAEAGEEVNRRTYTFAETDLNDPRFVRSPEAGGYGFNCQWLDDYHHALYTALAGTRCERYKEDYRGVAHLAASYKDGFVYSGQYCPTRKRVHGRSSQGIDGRKFVVFIQNHDQVGNKPAGTRLTAEVSYEAQKLAAGAYILSPYIPMIFMGEEYGETAPFYFFTEHGDAELIENVRRGRQEEFADDSGSEELKDPQALETFVHSKLNHNLAETFTGQLLRKFYKHLLKLRRSLSPLRVTDKNRMEAFQVREQLFVARRFGPDEDECLLVYNFSLQPVTFSLPIFGSWCLLLDSADASWGGPGDVNNETAEATDNIIVSLQPESFRIYCSPSICLQAMEPE